MVYARKSLIRLVMTLATAGTFWQLGGCSLGDAFAFARDFNPCGSILTCDPTFYRFATSGYEGPGVNPDIDPACTFPPFCAGDPFVTTGGTQP